MPTISLGLSLQVRGVMTCQRLHGFGHAQVGPKGMSLYVRTVSYGVQVCPIFARIQSHSLDTDLTQIGHLSSPHVPTTEMYGSQHQQNSEALAPQGARDGHPTWRTRGPLRGQRKSTS
jgi:hypothetical protein